MLRWLLSIAALILCLATGAAEAQRGPDTERTPDYNVWENVAERAEQSISEGQASDTALEDLRSEIVAFREQFLEAQGANSQRIQTLQSQLDALGDPPENGEEVPEIADRRAQLQEQLATLRAPVLAAEEAYTRADGLIGEIDNTIRTRQANQLFELGPAPINPTLYPGALRDLSSSVTTLWSELHEAWMSPVRQTDLRQALPVVIGLLVLSVVLLMRGREWVTRLVQSLRRRTRPGTGVWSFLASFGQILVPLAGIFTLSAALSATGMIGARGELLLDRLPVWAAVLLVIRWLAEQVFQKGDAPSGTLQLSAKHRVEGRFYANVLAGLLVLRGIRMSLTEFDDYSPSTVAVLQFPIVVICALMLFRLGQILRQAETSESDGTGFDGPGFRLGLARYLGLLAMAAGCIGPVLSAVGYARAGEYLVFPMIATLALAALLIVLQRFANDLFELFTGRPASDGDSLVPVLAGFALAVASLPLLALIWGARVADMTEIWARFREGFLIGETRISPTDFLTFLLVFAVGYGLTKLLQGGLRSSVLPRTRIDIGGQNALLSGIGYVGIFIAALVAITAAGIDLTALGYIAGALSLGIGFGLQNVVSNFVSGIILLIERPIGEGDWIEVNGNMGTVKDISVRSTRIETFDRTDVIVPNADLVSGTVTNYTRGNTLGRVIVSVGVAYGTDTRKVESILTSIAREHPLVMMNPEPFIYFKGFGADSLDFEIRAILSDVLNILVVQNEMHHEIAKRFAEEGIEIPFAQRDIWLRNPEALRSGTAPEDRPLARSAASSGSGSGNTDERTAGMQSDPPDAPDGPDGDR
ncbi:DUF3772 domain-containing protein [Thalassococcus sp. BH17M4-6]|uniref:DUF3772 domain-containing protein n=1 Tax=Thalassococcus sp. BH17M4-6 TaxID=3413148 RepID=UPI003BC64A87